MKLTKIKDKDMLFEAIKKKRQAISRELISKQKLCKPEGNDMIYFK